MYSTPERVVATQEGQSTIVGDSLRHRGAQELCGGETSDTSVFAMPCASEFDPFELRNRVIPEDYSNILARYRTTYGLAEGSVSYADIFDHLELELRLTAELLASTPSTRTQTFERCYNELYEKLPWLAGVGAEPDSDRWLALLGKRPQHVYEVGSGSGKLARALVAAGFDVDATDISSHRGGDRQDTDGLKWSATDGVHLADFTAGAPYDAVISDQVVEHLHPDDVLTHFEHAARILRADGRYIVRIPDALTGPHDVSRIFGYDQPIGMHLHEYTNSETVGIAESAGFVNARGVAPLPGPMVSRFGPVLVGRSVLTYYNFLENLLGRVSLAKRRKVMRYVPKALEPRVFLLLSKP